MGEQSLHVLLVAGGTNQLEYLASSLADKQSCSVDTATDAEQAIGLITHSNSPYYVVLIDDTLPPATGEGPQPSGIELMNKIRGLSPRSEFIILTDSGTDAGVRALKAGAFRYLTKPVNTDELGLSLQHAVEYRELKYSARGKRAPEHVLGDTAILLDGKGERVKIVERMERLIAGSPNGIIAADGAGNITIFNEQAEAILGYRKEEVIGSSVERLYLDAQEPRRVGDLLRSSIDGRLIAYVTSVKAKDGAEIPIELSATTLYDADKKRIGSVGYFEDLRPIRQKDRYLELLLKASKIVAGAENTKDGLQRLAKMLVSLLTSTFCRVLLLDETERLLITVAAQPFHEDLRWSPRLNEAIPVSYWRDMQGDLLDGKPIVLSHSDERFKKNLSGLSERLALNTPIKSLLTVPLIIEDKLVGLFQVGEVRSEERSRFTSEKIEVAGAIGAQIAVFINRMRLHENTERQKQLLASLDKALGHLRAEKDPSKLLQEVVRLAADLVGCEAGGLYTNFPHIKRLKLTATYGFPIRSIRNRLLHGEGVIGRAAQTGETQLIYNCSEPPDPDQIFAPQDFKAIVAIPLKHAGEVEAVLFVADISRERQIANADVLILERFVTRCSQVLETSRLLTSEQRVFSQIQVLHRIGDYIQSANNLEVILHAVLTGITAGYGLGFNRATLLLLDEMGRNLKGVMAIGQLDEQEARESWSQDKLIGSHDIGDYLKQLESGAMKATSLDTAIRGLYFPVNWQDQDAFSRVIFTRSHALLHNPQELSQVSPEFAEVFKPGTPLAIVPLMAKEKVIGLLVADNKFTESPITANDLESLMTFASTAAIAINNFELLSETMAGREKLRSLFEASSALISPQEPGQVLRGIVEQIRAAADAIWVSMIEIDDRGRAHSLVSFGRGELDPSISDAIRPDGISMMVMRTGQFVAIWDAGKDDRFNPVMRERGVAAALCLPMMLQGSRIGVVWINYDNPRRFAQWEIDALQLYVNQAVIAYDSSRRIAALKRMREAAEALAGAQNTQQVLDQIVRGVGGILQADSAVIWSYDATRNLFIKEGSVASGISEDIWNEFWRHEPKSGGTAYTVMERKYVDVGDISDTVQYPFLGTLTQELLRRIEARSFQGIALTVGEEMLGVLYVNYNRPRSFSEEERETVRTFANHAALALKKARLLDQVSNARNTARVVAEVTTLEDLERTLKSIVAGTRHALDCDALTLYAYDSDKRRLSHAPVTTGLYYSEKVHQISTMPPDSTVFKVLEHPNILVVEDVSSDPLFKDSRFARQEQIASFVAVPLTAGNDKVGVMFVNYRSRHRFTADEVNNIELFASQAAVAIRNAQLYEREQKRARALEALHEAGQALVGSLDEEEILRRFAEQAWKLTSSRNYKVGFADVKLVEDDELRLVAAYPNQESAKSYVGLLKTIEPRAKLTGVVGRAVRHKESQLVHNVNYDPDYIVLHEETRSEMVVPIQINDEVIGVINVEHPDESAFDMEDLFTLQSLAAQAGIAIQNARQYEELTQVQKLVGARTALAWVGMASASWGHSIRTRAMTIHELARLLRSDIAEGSSEAKLVKRLDAIEASADNILRIPLLAPLGAEEGVEKIAIHALIRERIKQIEDWESYKLVSYRLEPASNPHATVTANVAWLRRALDILIENAVEAMADSPRKQLSMGVYQKRDYVGIRISDTGRGVPSDELSSLFYLPVAKEGKTGIGLLLAQTIVQTYGGDIYLETTSPKGTTMIIRMPTEPGKTFASHTTSAFEIRRMYSDLQRAYDELKEIDAKKNEFLSIVSHELRTPLNYILRCIEDMLLGYFGKVTKDQKKILSAAFSSARDEDRLIKNLLDLSRIQIGKASLNPKRESLTDLIREVVNSFEDEARAKKISLTQQLPNQNSLTVRMDADKIKQVLRNLIGNAIKFTPKGGKVTISASKLKSGIEVQVEDTGIGIGEENLEEIFELFYQVDSSDRRRFGGTGIGLSITREYIEMHGGDLQVKSELKKGSTFSFRLPSKSRRKD